MARHVTKRQYILVFNGCYHGTVDETLVNLKGGKVVPRVILKIVKFPIPISRWETLALQWIPA
jgi:glutamate-1-semialdehyde aminotransferase